MSELSKAASDLLSFGLDRGVRELRSGMVLVPFVGTERDGDRRVDTFIGESFEDGIARAVAHVQGEHLAEGEQMVLVYDGYLARDDGRLDAVWAELIEASGQITVVAQPYKPKALFRRFETLGERVELSEGERGKL